MHNSPAKGGHFANAARVAVVAHDAGGAEIVSSYLRRNPLPCVYVVSGPALRVFERKLGAITNVPLATAVQQADAVLCGTGWQTDIEYSALALARASGKSTTAFLDHWVNYRERFTRDGVEQLPDAIWVGDEYALQRARELFADIPVTLIPNPYLMDCVEEIRVAQASQPRRAQDSARALFVCEPIKEHAALRFGNARHWGYTEDDALEYFLENVEVLDSPVEEVLVRLHPAEAAGKYDDILRRHWPRPVKVAGGEALAVQIAGASIVAGCNSMALAIALSADKRVICAIPPGGAPCVLPHAGIQMLQRLTATRGCVGAP